MTYIPGTGSVTPKPGEPEKTAEETSSAPEFHTVVNIAELKNPVNNEYVEEDKIWYNQLKYWLMAGGVISAVFAIFALYDWRSLFLIPLGPYIAYLAWYTRQWARKNTKSVDVFR